MDHLTVASLAEGSRVLTATQHPHRLPPATQRIGIAYDPATGDAEVIAIEVVVTPALAPRGALTESAGMPAGAWIDEITYSG